MKSLSVEAGMISCQLNRRQLETSNYTLHLLVSIKRYFVSVLLPVCLAMLLLKLSYSLLVELMLLSIDLIVGDKQLHITLACKYQHMSINIDC